MLADRYSTWNRRRNAARKAAVDRLIDAHHGEFQVFHVEELNKVRRHGD